MPKLTSLVDCLETAYVHTRTAQEWISEVVAELQPYLDSGMGTFGWLYDASDFTDLKFSHLILERVEPKIVEALFAASAHASTTTTLVRRHYATPAGPYSQSIGDLFATFEAWHTFMPPVGVRDLMVLNGMDPDRLGCAVLAPRKSVRAMSVARRALLSRVASHLSSGLRLLRRTQTIQQPDTIRPEAVLDAGGRLHHAVGAARSTAHREALETAARAMDRARGRLRRSDPEEALRIWRVLVNGHWSIVDQFDSDGRHYLVAYRNEPEAPKIGALSARERQIAAWAALGHSNKLIAYDLGIHTSTVAAHLASACKKLGLSRVSDLARAFPTALATQLEKDDSR